MNDPKPTASKAEVKADAKGQFAPAEKTSPNPCGRHSANPTVFSKDGDASIERIQEDRNKLK